MSEKVAGEGLSQGWPLPPGCLEGSLFHGLSPLGPWEMRPGGSLCCCYCYGPCCFLVSWEDSAGWNVEVTKGVLEMAKRLREKAPSLQQRPSSKHNVLHQSCGPLFCGDWSCTLPDQGDPGSGADCPLGHNFWHGHLSLVPFLAVPSLDCG